MDVHLLVSKSAAIDIKGYRHESRDPIRFMRAKLRFDIPGRIQSGW